MLSGAYSSLPLYVGENQEDCSFPELVVPEPLSLLSLISSPPHPSSLTDLLCPLLKHPL